MKKYFLFSAAYVKDRNRIENARGKEFILGTVVVNGSRKEFSMISDEANIFGYRDTRIVAYEDLSKIKYTDVSIKKKLRS